MSSKEAGVTPKTEKKKKGSVISLKAVSVNDEPEILQHQNKELYSQVRILKRRLRKQKKKHDELLEVKRQSLALQSLVLRNWNALDQDLASLVKPAQGNEHSLDPPKKKPKLGPQSDVKVSDFVPLLLTSGEEFLRYDISKVAVEVEENDVGDDEEADEKIVFSSVDDTMKERIAFTRRLLEAVSTNKSLDEVGISGPETKVNAKKYKTDLEAHIHRILFLEKRLVEMKNQVEDAQVEASVAVRRLNGWKSIPDEKAVPVAADSMENSEKSSPALKQEAKQKDGDTENSEKAPDKVLEDLEAARLLAEDRLKEIKELNEQQSEMAQELEESKQKIQKMDIDRDYNGAMNSLKGKYEKSQLLLSETEKKLKELRYSHSKELEVRDTFDIVVDAMANVTWKQKESLDAIKATHGLEKEMLDLKNQNNVLKDEIKVLKLELKTANECYEQAKKIDKISRKKIERKDQNFKRAKEEVDSLKMKLKEMHKRVTRLASDKCTAEDIKQTIKIKDKEIEDLQVSTKAATDELGVLVSTVERELKKKEKIEATQLKNFKKLKVEINSLKSDQQQEQRINKVKKALDSLRKDYQNAVSVVNPLKDHISKLEESKSRLEKLLQKCERACKEFEIRAREAEYVKGTLEAKVESNDEVQDTLKKKLDAQEKHNIKLQSEKLSRENKIRRLEEECTTLKRRLKKSKSQLDSATGGKGVMGNDVELKLETMENALRCPIYRHLWKDTILTRCNHMHSRKAIMDNYNKRNRKCPTCKLAYTRDEIKSVFLYQANEPE